MPPHSPIEDLENDVRRLRLGWYLFDFANSILIINGGLYFPQWIVIDNGASDIWFNLVVTVSSLLLLVSAPFLGFMADRHRQYIQSLRNNSIIMFSASLLIVAVGNMVDNVVLRVGLSLTAFGVIMYCYQLSLVYYNTIMSGLSLPPQYAKVSGWGLAWGWIGGIVAVLFILPFVNGHMPGFHQPGRLNAILPSTLMYGVVTTISFRLLRGLQLSPAEPLSPDSSRGYSQTMRSLLSILLRPNIYWFLLGYMFFAEAVLTIQNNATIYMDAVLKLGDTEKALSFLLFLAASAAGGIASAFISHRRGVKETFQLFLTLAIVSVILSAFNSRPLVGLILFTVVGLCNGGLWNMARVIFLLITPPTRRAALFGFYSAYERCATLIGPLIWSLPLLYKHSLGFHAYQLSLALMALLMVIALMCTQRFPNPDAKS